MSNIKIVFTKPSRVPVKALGPGSAFALCGEVFVAINVKALENIFQMKPIKKLEGCVLAVSIHSGMPETFDENCDVQPIHDAELRIPATKRE